MNPIAAYRAATATSWTRIEMLLALYDAAIESVERVVTSFDTPGDPSAITTEKLRARKLTLEILDGIDASQGDVAANCQRLIIYTLEQFRLDERAHWDAACRVLKTLRDGFAGIKSEAIELESQGQIPQLDVARAGFDVTVG